MPLLLILSLDYSPGVVEAGHQANKIIPVALHHLKAKRNKKIFLTVIFPTLLPFRLYQTD